MISQNGSTDDDGAQHGVNAAGATGDDIPSSADPVGTRIIYVIVAMVVIMFIIALGFLFEVARHRPR